MAIKIVSFPIKNGGSFHGYFSKFPSQKQQVLTWWRHCKLTADAWLGMCQEKNGGIHQEKMMDDSWQVYQKNGIYKYIWYIYNISMGYLWYINVKFKVYLRYIYIWSISINGISPKPLAILCHPSESFAPGKVEDSPEAAEKSSPWLSWLPSKYPLVPSGYLT